jgi:hypothetical protein
MVAQETVNHASTPSWSVPVSLVHDMSATIIGKC